MSRNSLTWSCSRPAGGVGGLGGGEGDAVVAPEIPQLLAGQRVGERAIVLVELVDRQQLDRRDAEAFEIGNLLHQAGERTRLGDGGRGWTVKPRTCTS